MPVGSRAAFARPAPGRAAPASSVFSVAGKASTALSRAMARAAGSSIDSATASASSGADSSSAAATRSRNMRLKKRLRQRLALGQLQRPCRVDPREHLQHLDLVVRVSLFQRFRGVGVDQPVRGGDILLGRGGDRRTHRLGRRARVSRVSVNVRSVTPAFTLRPAKRNPFARANTKVDASATPDNENRPSASDDVSVRAGASPDWKTVAPATGSPFASTIRPASVRVFAGFCSVIVTSVSRPASIDLFRGCDEFQRGLLGHLDLDVAGCRPKAPGPRTGPTSRAPPRSSRSIRRAHLQWRR